MTYSVTDFCFIDSHSPVGRNQIRDELLGLNVPGDIADWLLQELSDRDTRVAQIMRILDETEARLAELEKAEMEKRQWKNSLIA